MICEGKTVQKGSFAVMTQKCNKTANINANKLQFIHKLKLQKSQRGDITQQHIDI